MAKKQASGLYRTKVKIGIDAQGQPIYKYVSGKTKRELEEARREIERTYIIAPERQPDRLFGVYAAEWYQIRKKPLLSQSAQESYRTALNLHILPQFAERNLRAIQPKDLQLFVNGFTGCSATKITMIMASLKGIFSSAVVDGILDQDPMASVRKPTAKRAEEKRALTPAERKRVESACAGHTEGLYLALMYFLGLRPGEARGLQWGDFDWVEHTVHIQRDIDYKGGKSVGALKTRSSDRIIPVPDRLEQLLLPNRQLPHMFIISGENGDCISKSSAERMWIRLMIDCNMAEALPQPDDIDPSSRNARDLRRLFRPIITPHALRHNYATMCWENGLDPYTAMRLLGHSSIKTTIDIYTHLDNMQIRSMTNKVNEMFSGEKVAQKLHKVK